MNENDDFQTLLSWIKDDEAAEAASESTTAERTSFGTLPGSTSKNDDDDFQTVLTWLNEDQAADAEVAAESFADRDIRLNTHHAATSSPSRLNNNAKRAEAAEKASLSDTTAFSSTTKPNKSRARNPAVAEQTTQEYGADDLAMGFFSNLTRRIDSFPARENVEPEMGFFSKLLSRSPAEPEEAGFFSRPLSRSSNNTPSTASELSSGGTTNTPPESPAHQKPPELVLVANDSADATLPAKRRRVGETVAIEEKSPLPYTWLPLLDERTLTLAEYSMPASLPGCASLIEFSGWARALCWFIVTAHTAECAFTNFGPKTSDLRLPYAPITPVMHMVLDIALMSNLWISIALWPEDFGPYRYHFLLINLVSTAIFQSCSYKRIRAGKDQVTNRDPALWAASSSLDMQQPKHKEN